jgi:hypothetical protein
VDRILRANKQEQQQMNAFRLHVATAFAAALTMTCLPKVGDPRCDRRGVGAEARLQPPAAGPELQVLTLVGAR